MTKNGKNGEAQRGFWPGGRKVLGAHEQYRWPRRSTCAARSPEPGEGYFCTLAAYHRGDHVAHVMDGAVVRRWKP